VDSGVYRRLAGIAAQLVNQVTPHFRTSALYLYSKTSISFTEQKFNNL
jgi:hypothetical protein